MSDDRGDNRLWRRTLVGRNHNPIDRGWRLGAERRNLYRAGLVDIDATLDNNLIAFAGIEHEVCDFAFRDELDQSGFGIDFAFVEDVTVCVKNAEMCGICHWSSPLIERDGAGRAELRGDAVAERDARGNRARYVNRSRAAACHPGAEKGSGARTAGPGREPDDGHR